VDPSSHPDRITSKAPPKDKIRVSLLEDLKQRGKLKLDESFIDGAFAPAKERLLRGAY
jgi:hypothetical protein